MINAPEHHLPDVLGLDVDGVLNRCGKSGQGLESDKVALLKSIVARTDCKILLTSTWRKTEHQLARIERMCRDIGAQLIGSTPILEEQTTGGLYTARPRSEEIQAWIANHPVRKLVILDDDADMGRLSPHLIKTDSYTGLTPLIAEQVVAAFLN